MKKIYMEVVTSCSLCPNINNEGCPYANDRKLPKPIPYIHPDCLLPDKGAGLTVIFKEDEK
jgi:hypothetical protein